MSSGHALTLLVGCALVACQTSGAFSFTASSSASTSSSTSDSSTPAAAPATAPSQPPPAATPATPPPATTATTATTAPAEPSPATKTTEEPKANPATEPAVAAAPAAASPAEALPDQAAGLTLTDEQKRPLLKGWKKLETKVIPMVAHCGPVEVILDWEVYVQENKAKLDPKHMWSYVERCGQAVDALGEACQEPGQQVTGKFANNSSGRPHVRSLQCRYVADPRRPGVRPGEWEPGSGGDQLAVDFNDSCNDIGGTVAAFLKDKWPALGGDHFRGETDEQKREINKNETFLARDLTDTNRVCETAITMNVDYDGIISGRPARADASGTTGPRSARVARVDSETSAYFGRCTAAVKRLAALCGDPAAKAAVQKKLKRIECAYSDTLDGSRSKSGGMYTADRIDDPSDHCSFELDKGLWTMTCGWYQRVQGAAWLAKQLGFPDFFKTEPGPLVSGDTCQIDSQCQSLACLWIKRNPRTGKTIKRCR